MTDLFEQKKDDNKNISVFNSSINDLINDISSRIKLMEEKYHNLIRRNEVLENNLLNTEKELRIELKAFQKRIFDLKKIFQELKDKLDLIEGTVSNAVKKGEFLLIEKYIDLWQPANFLTREEARKLIIKELDDNLLEKLNKIKELDLLIEEKNKSLEDLSIKKVSKKKKKGFKE